LKSILLKGLEATASLWPPIAVAYNWVHQAAKILDNKPEFELDVVRLCFQGLVAAMSRWQSHSGVLENSIVHFLKVTRSYWSGLFHCYAVDGLPRTNNDLEHVFGQLRHHQRRCSGRKVASASLVLRGSVVVVAALATQLKTFQPAELVPAALATWQQLRSQLAQHRLKRVKQLRFRRSPSAYLATLEAKALQLTLLL